jgi:hypothetical protein
VIGQQFPTGAIFVNGQPMSGRHMPAEHLPAPTAIQADDMIVVNGSPHRHCRGSLDQGFCRFAETTEGLMNGRDQRRELIRRDQIASNIGGDDLGGEFGRLFIGHRLVPLFPAGNNTPPRSTLGGVLGSPYPSRRSSTILCGSIRPSTKTPPPLSLTKAYGTLLEPLGYEIFSDRRSSIAGNNRTPPLRSMLVRFNPHGGDRPVC